MGCGLRQTPVVVALAKEIDEILNLGEPLRRKVSELLDQRLLLECLAHGSAIIARLLESVWTRP